MQGYLLVNTIIGGQVLAEASEHLSATVGIVIIACISLLVSMFLTCELFNVRLTDAVDHFLWLQSAALVRTYPKHHCRQTCMRKFTLNVQVPNLDLDPEYHRIRRDACRRGQANRERIGTGSQTRHDGDGYIIWVVSRRLRPELVDPHTRLRRLPQQERLCMESLLLHLPRLLCLQRASPKQ